jgi:hypothetical protein
MRETERCSFVFVPSLPLILGDTVADFLPIFARDRQRLILAAGIYEGEDQRWKKRV